MWINLLDKNSTFYNLNIKQHNRFTPKLGREQHKLLKDHHRRQKGHAICWNWKSN